MTLLLRFTATGLRMRAVVESPRLTELAGVNADRVSMASWMLSSLIAGMAGVLLTPVFAGQIDYQSYEALVIAAIAAAVIGGLNSIPLACAGGLLLGVGQQLLFQYLPTNNIITSALEPALPFVVGFAVLVFSPIIARRRAVSDPLAGVDPPPPAPASANRSPGLTRMTRVKCDRVPRGRRLLPVLPRQQLVGRPHRARRDPRDHLLVDHGDHRLRRPDLAVPGVVRGGRRVCDCAAVDAPGGTGTGCDGDPGAVIAAVVGALLALPMLRLGGIFLSLATLAFAFFFDQVILQLGWVGAARRCCSCPDLFWVRST